MRVSEINNFRLIQGDILTQTWQQAQINQQVTTGQKVSAPSDAPAWAVNILQDHRILAEVTQYQSNLVVADDWMTASESAMQGVLDTLQRAQVLAEQMATGTVGTLEYQTAAYEVQGLIEQLASLVNSDLEGSYLFSGTLTQLAPLVNNLEETGNGPGSATQAGTTLKGGTYRLQFSRDDTGEDSTFTLASGNTLGSSLATPLNFDGWTTSQESQGDPPLGEVIYSDAGVSSLKDAVSNRVGETLSWTGDSEAGLQTYRTKGSINVVGAGDVTIGGDTYSVDSAADLVEQVNANADGDYFAVLSGSQNVSIISRGTGALELSGASGGVSVDQITTMEQLVDDINRGVQAQGVINLTGIPADSDTVILDGNEWTWATITAGKSVSTVEDYAEALANYVSANTDDYSATYSASGSSATVQITARTAGAAGNVTLSESGSNTVASGSLFGGLDPTELNPLKSGVQVQGVSTLVSDTASGHSSVISDYSPSGSTSHYLRFSRDTFGSSSTISSLGGTLGNNLGYDFSSWTTTAYSSSSTSQVVVSSQSLPDADSTVSDLVGETLTWLGDSAAGLQTYRTEAVVQVSASAGATLDVDGNTYSAESAEDLVEAINSDTGTGYFAWQELGTDTVHIVSTGSEFAVDNNVGGNVTFVGNAGGSNSVTNLDDLIAQLNSGVKAQGNFHFSGVPAATDTISVGDQTWTMAEIFGGADNIPSSVDQVASGVAGWINQHSDQVVASVSSSGGGATIMVQGRSEGSYANDITLSNTGSSITNTGALFGGLDGTGGETTGKIYGSGEADLRLSTTIHAYVTDVSGDDVTLRLKWYDDYGELHDDEIVLQGSGEGNSVEVPGMGGITLYKDQANYVEGAYFTIEVGHDQGNQEDIGINFSSGSQMAYNWTALDLVGDHRNTSLLGMSASAKSGNTGAGQINFAGSYSGMSERELNIDVIDGGSVPGDPADPVTLRVSWTDDQGEYHEEEVTLSGLGLDNSVEVPGAEGIEIYLTKGDTDGDSASFSTGDSFYGQIEKNSVSIMDSLVEWQYQLLYGDQEEAQTASQETLEMLGVAVTRLLDSISEVGSRQNRLEIRSLVLEDQSIFAGGEIEDLQQVDLTEAFLDLKAMQTSYSASLKVMATMVEMSLVELL